jgi:selenocysteine-specific elongation factor
MTRYFNRDSQTILFPKKKCQLSIAKTQSIDFYPRTTHDKIVTKPIIRNMVNNMHKKSYTIGMAGHIDHGKTSLTKALTNIDTDRLKEEKERNISIELGYAPLKIDGVPLNMSIIDVPGHERFIRQMIAGVGGIDLVLIIIAADEGIMPQTKEHMNILSLLNIHQAIIVMTKIDRAEEELVEIVYEDIKAFKQGTSFAAAPIVKVDSLSRKGIETLKELITDKLDTISTRNSNAPFRMPIDQAFSLKGIGTIVRGTIYDGQVHQEDKLFVMPSKEETKVRKLQVHSESVGTAYAGQRTAIQLAGIHKNDIERGHVLVKDPEFFTVTDTVDVTLSLVESIKSPIKQRSPIKFHTGALEVYGKIVFFDRNKVDENDKEILCQIRLQEPIVVSRGDRFILRRATPMETLGGGWVINPIGQKYKFGQQTIDMLMNKKDGSPSDQVLQALLKEEWMTNKELVKVLGFEENEVEKIVSDLEEDGHLIRINQSNVTAEGYLQLLNNMKTRLEQYHEYSPLKVGMNKPEFLQQLDCPKPVKDRLLSFWLNEKEISQHGQFISLPHFEPHYPEQWKKRIDSIVEQLRRDEITVEEWSVYTQSEKLPPQISEDLKQFLITSQHAYPLTDNYVIHCDTLHKNVDLLKSKTEKQFSLKDAKNILGVSRKYLIPFLELLDQLKLTDRVADARIWIEL